MVSGAGQSFRCGICLSMAGIDDDIRKAISDNIADATITVAGSGNGHFSLEVVSTAFDGLNTLARHRLVLQSIKELMAGHDAPVHAIDSLRTRTE